MTVSFGRYQGQAVGRLLDDEGYCQWLLDQEWFGRKRPDLAARVADRWLAESEKYRLGWEHGETAFIERLRRSLSSEELTLVQFRTMGCTCDLDVHLLRLRLRSDDDLGYLYVSEDGELVRHSPDCPYLAYRVRQREKQEREAAERRRYEETRCVATRTNGEKCRGVKWRGTDYCHYHRAQTGDAIADEAQRFLAGEERA